MNVYFNLYFLRLLLTFASALVTFPAIAAEEAKVPPLANQLPVNLPVKLTVVNVSPLEFSMGDEVRVEVDKLAEAMDKDKINPRDFVLYFNGRAIKGLQADVVEGTQTRQASGRLALLFKVRRTAESREVWPAFLGRPDLSTDRRQVAVSVGLPDQRAIDVDRNLSGKPKLVIYRKNRMYIMLIAFIVLVGAFVYYAKQSEVVRDSAPPNPPPGKKKPYSLARLQAALWFFLVVGSFLLLYIITGDHSNTITEQALILMGIGTGTALGAAMIDESKRQSTNDQLGALLPEAAKLQAEIANLQTSIAALEEMKKTNPPTATVDDLTELGKKQAELAEKAERGRQLTKQIDDVTAGLSKPVSEGFVTDLLTDANGISFHRFQMAAWTLVLAFIFCSSVYGNLSMPTFDGTLLALAGISSGTYLGFKIPEKQS